MFVGRLRFLSRTQGMQLHRGFGNCFAPHVMAVFCGTGGLFWDNFANGFALHVRPFKRRDGFVGRSTFGRALFHLEKICIEDTK